MLLLLRRCSSHNGTPLGKFVVGSLALMLFVSGIAAAHASVNLATFVASAPGANPAAYFVSVKQHRTDIYDSQFRRIGSIEGPTGGMKTDVQGDLFVNPGGGYGGQILVYVPPYDSKPRIINAGNVITYGMGVAPVSGMLVIFEVRKSDRQGQLAFYKRGDAQPCNVFEPAISGGIGNNGAFDAEGTLFFSGGRG